MLMGLIEKIKKFNESENPRIRLLRVFIFVISVVIIFASLSHIVLGVWVPLVAVASDSMYPHIQFGDIIFVESIDRTEIITSEKGKETGYTSFNDYGDVILYKFEGKEGLPPIIHRAMYYVEKGKPMWAGGPPAPHAGYITKGDHNHAGYITMDNPLADPDIDQIPVKKEWIIAVARFYRVPKLGYVSITVAPQVAVD